VRSTPTFPTTSSRFEQLAGDLLPSPTQDQVVATGFLRNSVLNQEGGIERSNFVSKLSSTVMDTLGKAFLGLTVNCAQCHNHKYDPFSQKDYYQLYAFLNNDDESFMEVPTPDQTKKREAILRRSANCRIRPSPGRPTC
jgi:hypothetical protein